MLAISALFNIHAWLTENSKSNCNNQKIMTAFTFKLGSFVIRSPLELSGSFSSTAAGPDSLTCLEPESLLWVLLHFPQPLMTRSRQTVSERSLKKTWSKRTYSLAPHKGKAINTLNTIFSRNHHSGKTVTPYERRENIVNCCILAYTCVAARKSSCPHLIHTNIHVAAQQAEPIAWTDSSCGHLSTSTNDGAGIRREVRAVHGK